MSLVSIPYAQSQLDYPVSSRFYYVHELYIAKNFSNKLSLQLVPVIVHRNWVVSKEEQNLVPAVGAGAAYTVNNWLSLCSEYYYLLPGNTADIYSNSFSLGVEFISGGGHIFQVNVSNSQGMTEKHFIPETTGKWIDGDIALGFNIIRNFHLKREPK